LSVASFPIGISEPQCLDGLIGEKVVPAVRLRSADELQSALPVLGIIGNDDRWLFAAASSFLSAHQPSLIPRRPDTVQLS
jgi:hypothetical protein